MLRDGDTMTAPAANAPGDALNDQERIRNGVSCPRRHARRLPRQCAGGTYCRRERRGGAAALPFRHR